MSYKKPKIKITTTIKPVGVQIYADNLFQHSIGYLFINTVPCYDVILKSGL